MTQKHKIVILANMVFACLFLIGAYSWFVYQMSANKNIQTVQIKIKKTSTTKQISIPALNIKNKIFNINNKKNLAKGIVQQYARQYPNQKTNFILAGHNLVYQKDFFTNLTKAKPKMKIYLKYKGRSFVYVIDRVMYINTKIKAYLKPNSNYGKLTLYTCTNDSQQSKRLLVESHLIKQELEEPL